MAHRIREAMKDDAPDGPLGGEGKIVEADETYYGKREDPLPHAAQRPSLHEARQDRPRSKRSWSALSSAAAKPACSMSSTQRRAASATCWSATSPARRRCTPTKASLYTDTRQGVRTHRTVKHSAGEYVRYEDDGSSTPTRSRTCSPFSSAACTASISIAARPTSPLPDEFEFRYNRRSGLGLTDAERAEPLPERHRRQAPHLSADW